MTFSTTTFVIAEVGVNHNGSMEMALALIDEAHHCGADAVKFQTFDPGRLVTRHAAKADYQRQATPDDESQYAMLKALALSESQFARLHDYCDRVGIEFLSSPFEEASASMLEALGMRVFKIPSGEITNLTLLDHIGAFGKPVILSTGMCHLAEVETALARLQRAGAGEVTLLHCVTEYPAPYEAINLAAMATLKAAFGVPVGYSDHTRGIEIPIAAVAMGATIIEKHFTLDTMLPGPDHAASLAPDEFQRMVQSIRHVELARGDGRKRPAPCEQANMDVVRKSIVVTRPVAAGEVITASHLAVKRPGTGLPPDLLDSVIGRRASRSIGVDELLDWQDVS
ncbi:N-acetylneuraminate synthase [Aidingimonas halophila]|uniref:N-acetylneuraminate synthase n=1 Tax=Aidingimonas halophila TaxID=574349 RepID=A0A1H3CHS3_9GAMM|nr:N-acetylneuraminate synthase [Aidingimonas halophila]GHC35447.1 N-acetylneuraminate synthase [Aidingimonas halophila]SDX53665.1 N-acetylneuraminate synthase [Aidingimonas halophila]